MENIIIFVVVNVIAVAVFLVYQALSDADKSQKRLPEILEKVSKEAADNKMEELIFSQFGEYISTLFALEERVEKKELQYKLNHDFPFYKGGNHELFYDLKNAKLLKRAREHEEYCQMGDAFSNLTLNYPELINYLYDKCKENQFKHNIQAWKKVIKEAEITHIFNLNNVTSYFSFGVCLGEELPKKINISSQINIKPPFYLYGKAYSKSNNSSQGDKIIFQDYIQLTHRVDYQEKFNHWYLLSIPI